MEGPSLAGLTPTDGDGSESILTRIQTSYTIFP